MPDATLLGAPGKPTGVMGPLTPLRSRNPRAPVRSKSAEVYPTIRPLLLMPCGRVSGAPGMSKLL
jgi:hypothetical protein